MGQGHGLNVWSLQFYLMNLTDLVTGDLFSEVDLGIRRLNHFRSVVIFQSMLLACFSLFFNAIVHYITLRY